MPAYDYRCTECDLVFEVRHGVGERVAIECPSCNAQAKRVFTPVGVVFKGSGFHNTDYRKKPADKSSPKPAEEKPAPACASKDAGSSKCAGCPAAE